MSSFGMDACTETFAISGTHEVNDVHELTQRLTKIWRGLGQSMTQWMSGINVSACIHAKGGHFEHLI